LVRVGVARRDDLRRRHLPVTSNSLRPFFAIICFFPFGNMLLGISTYHTFTVTDGGQFKNFILFQEYTFLY
jgi:hypothetical protein